MQTLLNEIDRRVLGVLMEKAMAQPEYYPMTLNAIVAACNQKQNRDPVLSLDDVAVEGALASLQERGLVTMLLPAHASRVKRYRHEAESVFGWQKDDRAVMTELLLRGPQTAGELKTRCARFIAFADLGAVNEVLEGLSRRQPPVVRSLPRSPGQSATRHTHLLYPPDEQPAVPQATVSQTTPGDLVAQVHKLREDLARLEEEVARLKAALDPPPTPPGSL